MQPSYTAPRLTRLVLALAVLALGSLGVAGEEAEPALAWLPGPRTAPLGEDLAEIQVPPDYLYLDAAGTRQLMYRMENPVSGNEVGTLAPASQEASWFLVFEYEPLGYVRDDDADSLDADAILTSIIEGTAEANQERRERGWAPIQIAGWHEEPHYDPTTHDLTWAIIGDSEHGRTINRIVKLLGRRGVMTATLISDPSEVVVASDRADLLLAGHQFRPGNTYAEFIPGEDKLARYGLAALIVGGAGAALTKAGFLARFWKVIAAGAVGLAAVARRLYGSRRARQRSVENA